MTYASIIKSFASVGDETGAEDALRRMQEQGKVPTAIEYNALLSAYATNGNFEGAEDVLGRMSNGGGETCKPTVVTFSTLLNAYSHKGHTDGAEEVLQRMQMQGLEPNQITYTSLVSGYAKNGNWQGANDVLRRMQQNEIPPSTSTWNAAISAHANRGNWAGAEEVLQHMSSSNCPVTEVSYNALIDAYAHKGHWEGAEDVLRRMNKLPELEPNVVSWTSVIVRGVFFLKIVVCQNGRAWVEGLLLGSVRFISHPSFLTTSTSCTHTQNAYAHKGNWQGAENVLRRMQYQGSRPNIVSYNALLTAYAKEGQWHGAEDVLRRVHEDPHVQATTTTYNLLLVRKCLVCVSICVSERAGMGEGHL